MEAASPRAASAVVRLHYGGRGSSPAVQTRSRAGQVSQQRAGAEAMSLSANELADTGPLFPAAHGPAPVAAYSPSNAPVGAKTVSH